MASVPVVVKHQGNKYEVDVDTSCPGEIFKYQLFSLTSVEPERQKIIVKGKQLKDDTDMATLGLKPGTQIIMMGTPGTDNVSLVRPKVAIKFVEDMTAAEAARQEGAVPAGLENLGNTCYLNATLQGLRSIPELHESLKGYAPDVPGNASASLSRLDLVSQMRELFHQLSETQDGLPPLAFLNALRLLHPQFAEKSKSGSGYAQQDAEEAWSQIVAQLRQKLRVKGMDGKPGKAADQDLSFVDRYMALEFTTSIECDDPAAKEAGEEPVVDKEVLPKLSCHIDTTINHLRDGILASLSEKLEKKSAVLDRNANYTKTSRVSRLPKYLTVHFVRFFWKRDVQKKAKIMRKVTFPHELDMVEFCTDELKKALVPVRDKVREIRKDEDDMERARKRRKKNPAEAAGSSGAGPAGPATPAATTTAAKGKKPAASTDADADMIEYKTDMQVEKEKRATLLAAKKELMVLVNQDVAKDDGANQSGLYELRGVVTHQGASADSGHYTAYVKKQAPVDPATGEKGEEDGNWWWFNDSNVTEVTADKIDALAGGGESHSALILLYRAIPLPSMEEEKE